jgi:HD-like signal output (HDOD) protein
MALMSSFFKKKNHSQVSGKTAGEKITVETLKRLIPVRNLSNDKLHSFALEHTSELIPAKKVIFNINEPSDAAFYLLKGTVSLSDSNGNTIKIEATDDRAKFPISSGLKHTTSATSKSKVSILKVSQKIMSINSEKPKASELIIPEELSENQLLQMFTQHFLDDELEIPSLPNVAIQLRKAMQQEIGIDEAVKIIQLDPVISAKLVEVANCPLYISAVPAKSCFEAVKRIGLLATRDLVISLSVKNIFKSNLAPIKKHMDKLWKNSLYLSSLSFVLASASKQKKPEEALLAGLICDIGAVPFFNFVANLPSSYYNEEELQKAIPTIKGIIGASILRKWNFPQEFIDVVLMSDDWYHYSDESLSYTDIVVLSRLHSQIGKKGVSTLPAITSIPAASKLKNITLSPENSLSILHDAKDKINDALKSFSS